MCLDALAAQRRLPNDVMVVVRPDDLLTHDALRARPDDSLPWRIVPVEAPGLVAARNAGLAACRAGIVAFCDDDTRPHADWVERILGHFVRDAELGGLGGRDWCHDGESFDTGCRDVVGRFQWFGRAIGNHHLGRGTPREVQFLKGANMSYRTEAVNALRFDARLRGRAAQAHDDFAFSLAVGRSKWRLVYDPAVAVDHYCFSRDQPRPYVSTSALSDAQAYIDSVYNYVLVTWGGLPLLSKPIFLIWSLLVGIRPYPGVLQAVRFAPSQKGLIWRKFVLCQRGSLAAYGTLLSQPWVTRVVALNPQRAG
jgi:GT2 family glycosyltransferase